MLGDLHLLQKYMSVTTVTGYCQWWPFLAQGTARDGFQEQQQWSATGGHPRHLSTLPSETCCPSTQDNTSCLTEAWGQLQAPLHQQPSITSGKFSGSPLPQHRKGHMARQTWWAPSLISRPEGLFCICEVPPTKTAGLTATKMQKMVLYLLCQVEDKHLASHV